MLDPVEALLDSGFHRVVVLDGTECGLDTEQSLILALWCYEAEKQPASDGAWIHPYYFASQKAYTAASSLVKSGAFPGLALRDEIRVKPIFARLPDFSQGTNTISYIRGIGSRFHVQILTYTPRLPATAHLLSENKPLHCGECRKCVEACPTNALEGGVFHRERCIRNWMMVGGEVPEEIRAKIGVNLTLPNRVLSQSCLLAGCSGDTSLIPLLMPLLHHPSPAVTTHATWALSRLQEGISFLSEL